MSNGWSFETRQIHVGQEPDATTGARALPIYQTTSFVFPSAEAAAARFALAELDPIYTRIGNPTQDAVEQRIASLEGGVGALLLASGQAATTFALLNVAEAGDHIVSSPSIYGGTYNLLAHSLKKLGIEVTFVSDPDNLDEWRAAVRPNTKAFFGEVVSNPRQDVLDIENISAIAGVIVDGGKFDYTKDPEKFPGFNTPDESYNGLVFGRDLGVGSALGANLSYILKARVQLLRDLGSAVAPFNAFLIAQGIETLSLRVERHVANAVAVAEWLEANENVEAVAYAGLPSSPWFERGRKYGPNGTGAVIAFDIKGGIDAGKRFVDGLELHSHVANLGDVRSLVIHPASTTHAQLTPEQQIASGVRPGLVRLSVGIENVADIIADLEAGFRAAKSA